VCYISSFFDCRILIRVYDVIVYESIVCLLFVVCVQTKCVRFFFNFVLSFLFRLISCTRTPRETCSFMKGSSGRFSLNACVHVANRNIVTMQS